MNTWLILFFVIAYSCGLLNVFLLGLLSYRDRDRLYIHELLLMAAFTTLVMVQGAELVWSDISLQETLNWIERFFSDVGVALLIYALPSYIHVLAPSPRTQLLDRIFLILAMVAAVSSVVFHVINWVIGSEALFILLLAVILYCISLGVQQIFINIRNKLRGIVVIEAKAVSMNGETMKMAIRMGMLTMILLPFLIYFDFFNTSDRVFIPEFLKNFHVTPVIYLTWSLMLMTLRIGSILTIPQASGRIIHEVGDDFCTQYGISPREREVMMLLIEGKSYDELATTLFISLSTAKTHIGRIYRKIGVNSKVELIHALQRKEKPVNQPKS